MSSEKVALITGGSRGIGEGLVRHFTENGYRVCFTYRTSGERAKMVEKECNDRGGSAIAYRSDAADYDAAGELIQQVVDEHEQVDVLINNAGITDDTLMLRMSENQWDRVIRVNLKSVFNLTKHVLRPMMRERKGSIINMSSVVGVFGNAGQANYAASKSGIHGFTKSIAKEVGSRNIRCNAIAPGFIETEMTGELDEETRKKYAENIPLRRWGSIHDVAELALFLASDRSAYMTGQVISVCGGLNI